MFGVYLNVRCLNHCFYSGRTTLQSDSRPRRSRALAIGSHAVVITTRCANQYSKRRADHGNDDEADEADDEEKLRIFVRRGSR